MVILEDPAWPPTPRIDAFPADPVIPDPEAGNQSPQRLQLRLDQFFKLGRCSRIEQQADPCHPDLKSSLLILKD